MAPTNVAQEEVREPSPYTQALAKRVVRKIDVRILAIMFVTYNLNFMDKTILSSAAVFGLTEDNHLINSQYSWVSSIFYFGYLFFEYPTTILIQRLPIGKYLSGVILLWGAIVASTAACTTFGGLATCRFLLGVAIFGVITSLWSIVVLFLLPDTINDAGFLTEEEKQYAEDRVVLGGAGRVDPINSQWKMEQVVECLTDPKTYFFAAISVLTQIPNGGTGSFGNLALKSFGFTSLESTLITLPASVIAMSTILGTGWLAGRFKNITTFLLIAVVLPPVVGSAIIFSVDTRGVRLFAYYCVWTPSIPTDLCLLTQFQLQTGPGAIPLSLGLVSSNYKGVTKKMTVTAIIFLTYCAGNISGPQTFKTSEKAAGYPTAFRAILICYGLVVFVSLGLRLYLSFVNKKRDREEGGAPATEDLTAPDKRHLTADDYEDVTDLNTPGFRYRL
ncbi:hypothetical protein PZA11_006771 [Diplocarpon coronariae]